MAVSREEIQKLSVSEKLQLIEELWESIESSSEEPALTDAQRAEIDRRLAAYDRNPANVSSWDEVYARIKRRE